MSVRKRGRVQRDTTHGEGLVFVEGKQYPFQLEGHWKSEFAPRVDMVVEAELDEDGALLGLYAVRGHAVASEQAAQVMSVAGATGRQLYEDVRTRGLPALTDHARRIGYPILGALAAVVAGWWWLPWITVPAFGDGMSFTLYDGLVLLKALGSNPMQMMAAFAGGERPGAGGYGLVAVLAVLAAVVPQFVPGRRLALGMMAPAAFMGLVGLAYYFLVSSLMDATTDAAASAAGPMAAAFASQATQQATDALADAVAIGLGAYLSIGGAGYLAWQGFVRFRNAGAGASPFAGELSPAAAAAAAAARAHAGRAASVAQASGKRLVEDLRARGLPALRERAAEIGIPLLAASALVIVGWLALPFLSVEHEGFALSASFVRVLRVLNTIETRPSHALAVMWGAETAPLGSYGFLAAVALLGAFAHRLSSDRRAYLGLLAPLAFTLFVAVRLVLDVRSFAGSAARAGVALEPIYGSFADRMAQPALSALAASAFPGLGAPVALLGAGYLAWLGLTRFRAAAAAPAVDGASATAPSMPSSAPAGAAHPAAGFAIEATTHSAAAVGVSVQLGAPEGAPSTMGGLPAGAPAAAVVTAPATTAERRVGAPTPPTPTPPQVAREHVGAAGTLATVAMPSMAPAPAVGPVPVAPGDNPSRLSAQDLTASAHPPADAPTSGKTAVLPAAPPRRLGVLVAAAAAVTALAVAGGAGAAYLFLKPGSSASAEPAPGGDGAVADGAEAGGAEGYAAEGPASGEDGAQAAAGAASDTSADVAPVVEEQVAAPPSPEPKPARLLQARPTRLFKRDAGELRELEWTTVNGPEVVLALRAPEETVDGRVRLVAHFPGAPRRGSVLASWECSFTDCEVLVAPRSDGSALVRMENLASGAHEGDARILHLRWVPELGRVDTVDQWRGTARDYWLGEAPDWTEMRRRG